MTLQPTVTPKHPADDFVEITPTGLVVTRPFTFDEFQDRYNLYEIMEEKLPIIMADLLIAGEKRFGETYAQAINVTGRKLQTVQNWVYAMKPFPHSRRREELTISHYSEIASLEPDQQTLLIDEIVEKSLTTRVLRKRKYEVQGRRYSFTLFLPFEECPSWNDFYKMGHWSDRKKEADRIHELVYWTMLEKMEDKREPFSDPVEVIITSYRKNPLDSDNIPAKFYIDGLTQEWDGDELVKPGVLVDDTRRWVVSTKTVPGKISSSNPAGLRIELKVARSEWNDQET